MIFFSRSFIFVTLSTQPNNSLIFFYKNILYIWNTRQKEKKNGRRVEERFFSASTETLLLSLFLFSILNYLNLKIYLKDVYDYLNLKDIDVHVVLLYPKY